MRAVLVRSLALVAVLVASAGSSTASTERSVLVVANGRHPWSVRLATTYIGARDIDPGQLLTLDVATDATITREVYQRAIEAPVARWLRQHEATDRIRFVVLGPGLPLRIAGTSGRSGNGASVDSELAILYRRMTGAVTPLAGFVRNPYFVDGTLAEPHPFDRTAQDIYLVTRLDGRTEDEALALVTRGALRPATHVIVLDGRPAEASGAEARWLAEAGPRVQAVQPKARVIADATADVVRGVAGVTGYVAWGSNDAPERVPPVSFGPGAIASSFMSSDARTMAAPPAEWVPGPWDDRKHYFAGSPETLAADWLAAGLTGLGSQVSEPYLDGAFRPGTLLEAWMRGYTLAESYYLALPYLSWQSVVFGDPLARMADAPYDPPQGKGDEPELTFTARAALILREGHPGLNAAAATLMARANMSIARGETAQARGLLEQVTVMAPAYVPGLLALGQVYDAEKRHDLARARYEAVLELEPANVVALNNLAYTVGVHEARPKDALAWAERAGALGSNSPAVLDTLGWIRHLAGDSKGALAPLRQAVQEADRLCEAWTHLAVVERAAGTGAAAEKAEERARACLAAQRE